MMITFRNLILSGILASSIGITPAPCAAQAPSAVQTATPAASGVTTPVTVMVPEPDTELVVDGKPVDGTGTTRIVEAPAAARGTAHEHAFTIEWRPNAYTVMTRSKTVSVRAGEPVVVDLTIDDPSDRVRVIYVPTPPDVAEEMVRLAGVTADDIVYEPGCGDARITIAAMRRGAQRAICVDIEPERVEDSRAKVTDAGMQDRIDVRLGDALDVKDLSEVTVVLLYMGDHFNLLIRPVLWRDLKVGSRVVSHRFLMGDWAPDRSVSVTTPDDGVYEVHLWTVTEEVKRKLEAR
ncbi:MAG: TIGR03000 domain-containing protein [Vicinamibacterales bacterium]